MSNQVRKMSVYGSSSQPSLIPHVNKRKSLYLPNITGSLNTRSSKSQYNHKRNKSVLDSSKNLNKNTGDLDKYIRDMERLYDNKITKIKLLDYELDRNLASIKHNLQGHSAPFSYS